MLLLLLLLIFPFFLDFEAVEEPIFLASHKISAILRLRVPRFPPDCLLYMKAEGEEGFLADWL